MSITHQIHKLNKAASSVIPNWARLLFPILLGGILIFIVTHIMYFGGKRESLVAQAETSMIRWALAFAQDSAGTPDTRVVTISVTDSDIPTLDLAPNSLLVDANISEYAAVVEHVAASNPEWIVVSWLTYAHPITQEYLKPLTDVIDRMRLRNKITLAVNLYASGTIAPEFIKAYNIVEARDCYYDINLFCTVAPEWTWMPQQIINRYFSTKPAWHVSYNLPHILPNILLNLPAPQTLTKHTFLDFRPPVMSNIVPGSIVFIGNDTTQSLHYRDNKDALQRTYTASSSPRRTLLKDGVPWHFFWAEMTAMFISNNTVAVVPEWIGQATIAAMTLAIIIAIRLVGSIALVPFFAFALSLPFANMFGISYFKIYMPVMPIVIAGFIVFTAATFITVAYSSYQKWRFQAAEDLAGKTADIKQNFIHLISHNLNTPVAQLRGLLELLSSQNPDDQGIKRASVLLEYIRVTVRAVLNTSTMANQPLMPLEHPIRAFIHEFCDNEISFFRRTGVELTITPREDDEEAGEIWFYRFTFDREIVNACIFYAAAHLVLETSTKKITLKMSPVNDEPSDPRGLIISLSGGSSSENKPHEHTEFARNALMRFLAMAAARGILQFKRHESEITLTFPTTPS